MIKRYFANKDNTITNAYQADLITRGTGSNMGQADVLEVFSVYGQVSNSAGLQRSAANILLQFNTQQINNDKNTGTISSGSAFYLKLFNCRHASTLPRDYSLQIIDLAQSWQEGLGLDMENYSDLTYDVRGSNWIKRWGANVNEITKFTFGSDGKVNYASTAAGTNYIKIYNGATAVDIWFQTSGTDIAPPGSSGPLEIDIQTDTNKEEIAEQFKTSVAANDNFSGANRVDNIVYVTASTAGPSTAPVALVPAEGVWFGSILSTEVWDAGNGNWRDPGSTSGSYIYTANFPEGDENLEVNVTPLVNRWIENNQTNNGFVIKINQTLAEEDRSYYTKKFFGRASHNWFERPVLEARWDSAKQDDRGEFYLSSSLASKNDNINTIYLYNYARGRLANIPSINNTGHLGGRRVMVSLFSGSAQNNAPSGSALKLVADGTHVGSTNQYVVTGGWVSKGIYSASFAYTGSSTIEDIYDVWFSGSSTVKDATKSPMQFSTGSITIKRFASLQYSYTPKYVFAVSNRNQNYYYDQTHRIRLYAREKNWSPNIYTTATTVPNSLVFESASYQIYRVTDSKVVIPYDTGSNQATRLSYDVSGNYFDVDCTMLQPNYQYGINFSIYDPDTLSYEEQPFVYNFRVIKNES